MALPAKIKRSFQEGGFSSVAKKTWHKAKTKYLWYFARQAPLSYLSWFAHQMPQGLPAAPVEIKELAITEADVAIAGRLLAAFKKAQAEEPRETNNEIDLWDVIEHEHHKDFGEILRAGDVRQVAEYLANMHRYGLTQGISDFGGDYKVMKASARARHRKGAITKDILVSLAEAIGILPYEVFPVKAGKPNIYHDADDLVDAIEKKLGASIAPPDIDGGLTKLALRKGSFHERDLWSVYTAWRISKLVPEGSAIAEIGAGMGKVAWYAAHFGFRDYEIFDLPFMNIVQGWYLLKSMPDANIILYGEENNSGAKKHNSIKVLPYWEFAKNQKHYALVLNADSFPEIDRGVVEQYLKAIKSCGDYFFSINQEKQAPLIEGTEKKHLVVPEVVDSLGGYKRIYRFPFWLRKDYVEEFYEVLTLA
jgi:putative sugar O-methyltransferase